jgi:hypothetical protein
MGREKAEGARSFERIADTIMYRWSAERDTWVSPTEVQHARAYLEHAGVTTRALPDGRFAVGSDTVNACGEAHLVLLGLRRLLELRRSRRS